MRKETKMVNMREGRFEDVFGGDAESLTAVAHCGHCTLEGPCPPRCVLCASDRLFGNTPLERAIKEDPRLGLENYGWES